MAQPSIDVERLVRDVLAELGRAPASGAQSAHAASPHRQRSPAETTSADVGADLAVQSRVVTTAELEGRLAGIGRLVVPPQAVVTPSVRDELKRKNIALVYGRPAEASVGRAVRLVMLVLGSRFDPLLLTRALQNEGIEVHSHRTDCLVAATDQLAGELAKPGTLGLLVTPYPAVGICLANRHSGVRAVSGVDAGQVTADADSVGANLLVVNPEAAAFFQIKQMVSRFCGEGPRECPTALRERLG